MNTKQLELNVLIEKIRSNDASLRHVLEIRYLSRRYGMTLCFNCSDE